MDNIDRRPAVTFSPDGRLTLACGAAAVLAIGLAFVSDDAGRILFGLAAALLAGYVVTDRVYSPRLMADEDGLTIRSPFTNARLAWADVERVHADARQRYGLRSVTLEVDAGETFVVLSRRALGEDPELVAEVVNSYVPRLG